MRPSRSSDARNATLRFRSSRPTSGLNCAPPLYTQSAMNNCDLPSGVRDDVQQSFFPSGENTGRPSNPSVKVTRVGSPPWASTRYNSKFEKLSSLDVNITYLPEGW